MLGIGQLNQLLDFLKASNATFKLIASPVTWTSNFPNPDTWFGFQFEKKLILDFIQSNNISGVIFLSGGKGSSGIWELRPGKKKNFKKIVHFFGRDF